MRDAETAEIETGGARTTTAEIETGGARTTTAEIETGGARTTTAEIETGGARASEEESAAIEALAKVTAALPGGGEERQGQVSMAAAVARAIREERHLAVQAGTGTGKSLAYLVPAVLSGRKVIVATATKALQDQLARKDLPHLANSLVTGFSFSVLKGRSNYLCMQKVREVSGHGMPGGEEQLPMGTEGGVPSGNAAGWDTQDDGTEAQAGPRRFVGDLKRLLSWASRTRTADISELDYEPDPRAWGALSTTSRECPGASKCPSGGGCFAEAARHRAASVDVVITNTHLYGAHLASDGGVLPPHDVVVFDEAHQLEDIATSSLGIELGGGAFRSLARQIKPLLDKDNADVADDLNAAGDLIEAAATRSVGQRLKGNRVEDVASAVTIAQQRLSRATSALRAVDIAGVDQHLPGLGVTAGSPAAGTAKEAAKSRALQGAASLAEDLAHLAMAGDNDVVWVEESDRAPVIKMAPIDVSAALATRLWPQVTAVLTSATLPEGLVVRLGLVAVEPVERSASEPLTRSGADLRERSGAEPGERSGAESAGPLLATVMDVGSPFPFATNSLLYCAAHLPDPRAPESQAALHDELMALIGASQGRALALFTSWRAMRSAVESARNRISYTVLAQGDLPKHELLRRFSEEESSCLFATMSFWQGVDVPGAALSLVAIDRIPFPRPDEPLMMARRELAGSGAFRSVDIPRAATLLAQGAGRLIRSVTDRGVVAVLDPRLATANYRKALLASLPPMKRTISLTEVEKFFNR